MLVQLRAVLEAESHGEQSPFEPAARLGGVEVDWPAVLAAQAAAVAGTDTTVADEAS